MEELEKYYNIHEHLNFRYLCDDPNNMQCFRFSNQDCLDVEDYDLDSQSLEFLEDDDGDWEFDNLLDQFRQKLTFD